MQATRKKRKLLHNPVLHIILIILVFFTFYPLFFTVMTSFKDNEQFYANFWALPNPVIWKNYADAFSSICLLYTSRCV